MNDDSYMKLDSSELKVHVYWIVQKLRAFRRQVKQQLVLEGAARFLGVLVGMFLVSLVLDRWLRLSTVVRVPVALAMVVGAAWCYGRYVRSKLRSQLDLIDLAALLEPRKPGITQQVATLLQLPNQLQGTTSSQDLVEYAVERSAGAIEDADFRGEVDQGRSLLFGLTCGALILVPVLFAVNFPATAGLWAKRWLLASNDAWPQETYLEVVGFAEGSGVLIPRGSSYTLKVRAQDGSVEPEFVYFTAVDTQKEKVNGTMTRFAGNDFRHTFDAVQSDLMVTVRGGDDRLGPLAIVPVDRPRIGELEIVARHPQDQEDTVFSFAGQLSDLSFLPHTQLTLRGKSTAPLAGIELESTSGRPEGVTLAEGGLEFSASWEHLETSELEIRMTAKHGMIASRPVPVSIGLKKDRAPAVSLRFSGVRLRVTPQARIPITVMARDDFGLDVVLLSFNVVKEDGMQMSIPLFEAEEGVNETDLQLKHEIALEDYSIPAGVSLRVQSTSTDACYTGTQIGKSRELAFAVVPPEELYREIILRLQGHRAQFRKATDKAEEMSSKLDVLAPGQSARDLTRQARSLQQQTARVKQAFSDALTEMQLNALGSDEVHDLIQRQIIDPLGRLKDDRLTDQITRLDALNRGGSPVLIEEAGAGQRAVVILMKEILKSMSQWESFVDVLNQLDEVIQIEKKVVDGTGKVKIKEGEDLFDD